jgi:RNA recognition motif-containing protein
MRASAMHMEQLHRGWPSNRCFWSHHLKSDPLTSFLFLITVTKSDIEEHFSSHGSGKITEIKLMNGFGFIEYDDQLDARDIVPGKNGS